MHIFREITSVEFTVLSGNGRKHEKHLMGKMQFERLY